MKICQKCGYENEDDSKFCISCGNTFQNVVQQNQNLDFNPDNNKSDFQQQYTANPSQQENNANDNQGIDNNQVPDQQNMQQQYPSQYSNEQYPNQYPNQQYPNQQYPNQQINYPTSQKNVWIAVLLNVIGGFLFYFLSGIGHLYLGLYKRGAVLCVTGLIISLLNVAILFIFSPVIGSLLSLVLGIILVIYAAYDAYLCTHAINEGQPIPLLFGFLDIQ